MKTDWIAFRKMFKIPIPIVEYADYYIKQLARSPEYAHLPGLVEEFKGWQNRCQGSIGQTRNQTLERLIEYLTNTNACNDLRLRPMPPAVPTTCDQRTAFSDGRWLISLDLIQANFHTFKALGLPHDTWEQLCTDQEIDPVLAKSKRFRQMVFGYLHPKRNQRLQSQQTQLMWAFLETCGADVVKVFQEHDELILASDQPVEKLIQWAREAVAQVQDYPVRLSLHQKWPIVDEGHQYLVSHHDLDTLRRTHSSLFGVPGTRYHYIFKKYILAEPATHLDRLFEVDGHLAAWEN